MQWVADIEIKRNVKINRCCVFENGQKGDVAINNKEHIESRLRKYPWGNEHRTVFFQTYYMNGHIPVENIVGFDVYEIEEWDLER